LYTSRVSFGIVYHHLHAKTGGSETRFNSKIARPDLPLYSAMLRGQPITRKYRYTKKTTQEIDEAQLLYIANAPTGLLSKRLQCLRQ
jgi:hypothetical protein